MEHFTTGDYPYMVEIATEVVMQPCYNFGHEFAYGLDLIIAALEGMLAAVRSRP